MKNFYLTVATFLFATISFSQTAKTRPVSSNELNQVKNGAVAAQPALSALPKQQANTIQTHQNPTGSHTCKSHELNEKHYQERGILEEYNQDYIQGTARMTVNPPMRTPGTNTISVIFHVVYNPSSPAENVSNALINQVFDDLTEDFQLMNTDAANARAGFGFTPADANINFCLATQDPSGNPLSEIGVVRVSTTEDWYDSDGGEENKMKSSSTGGSQIWDRNKYLNIWICDISNGASSGTAGYAYRPTTSYLPSSSIDGIVLDYNLGMNNDNVLTHEVGHYLGLDHTWGGSGGCSNDDGFGDTPNTAGPSFDYSGSCSGNQETCTGIQTQYENYMDYSNCTVMFTQNQSDFMLTILTGIRNPLLLSTGCDPTNTPPNSAFSSIPAGPAPVIIPVNGGVNLIDESTNVPTSWSWTISGSQGTDWNFTGGTNATSQDPQIEFYTPGFYNVALTASNAYGADPSPASETNYIQVVAPAAGTACDTLRNWDPADAEANGYYYYTAQWGYSPGHGEFCGGSDCYGLQYAEKFTYGSSAEVRRISMPFFQADDLSGTGTIVFKVYADAAGTPGAELATDTVNIADITAGGWEEFDFTTPATVTGTFWAGFELFYGSPQDTILVGMTDTRTGANDSYYIDINGFGWYDATSLGITGSIAIDVMLSNGPDPVANFTATDAAVCQGGEISVNGSGSTNVTNYYWYLTDDPLTTIISTSYTPSNTYSFPTAGDYSIYLFGDGSCKTDAVVLPVTVNTVPTATVTPTATTCGNNNGSIAISGVSGGDGLTYQYSLDGVNYVTTTTFNNLPSGNYNVYVKTDGDNCESIYPVTIGSSTGFSAGISSNTEVCPGGSSTITASGGVSYQWYDGGTSLGTTASINVTPGASTQYSCIVTNGSGCQSTVYTTVTVNTPPTAPVISASGPTTFCSGGSITLTSSYGSNNNWSTSETGNSIVVSNTGSYSVTYTDGNGCTNTSAPMNVTVNANPTISAGTVTNPSSCGTSTGSIQVTGPGAGVVAWSGTASGTTGSVTLPYTIGSLTAGSYNITYTDGNGCVSAVLNQTLTDPSAPPAPVITPSGSTTFCSGGSVTLTSSYGSGNVWSTSQTSASIVVTNSGTYSVTYTDMSGCSSSSAPVVVTVNSLPTINAGSDQTICQGTSVTLSGSGAGVGGSYSWNNGVMNGVAFTPAAGTVTYTVTGINSNGCQNTDQVVVNVNALPAVNAGIDQIICEGGSVTLSGSNAVSYVWDNGVTNNTPFTPSVGSTNYTLTGIDANGCQNTDQVIVTVNALPVVNAGSDLNMCEGTSVVLNGSGANSYTWDNSVINGTPFVQAVGTVNYTVTGIDVNGCVNSDQVVVTVNPNPVVSFSPLTDVCNTDGEFTLTGGSPAGGIYYGTGVSVGQFDPAIAGAGTHTITYTYIDGNGCSDLATQAITVDDCSAIDEIIAQKIKIYPNPIQDNLNIGFEGEFNFTIVDAQGRLVAVSKGINLVTLSIASFEAGVYFVTVQNEEIQATIRIVKGN